MNVSDHTERKVPLPGQLHVPTEKIAELKKLFSTYQAETERRTNREIVKVGLVVEILDCSKSIYL